METTTMSLDFPLFSTTKVQVYQDPLTLFRFILNKYYIRTTEHCSSMQIQKENIRSAILSIAKEEFLQHGFKGTSMRTIAQKSEVGLSNIYNYFKNKDEIFKEVLTPVLQVIENMFEEHNEEQFLTLEVFTSKDLMDQNMRNMVNLVEQYRSELKLLLFHSYGSSLENFREEYLKRSSQTGIEYLQQMKKRYPHLNIDVTPFFIHMTSSWTLTVIGEIVNHHQLPHDELEKFMKEYITYATAGWEKLMEV